MKHLSADALRADMRAVIEFALGVLPGDTKGQKVTGVARLIGVKPRRIEDYCWGREIHPTAAEYLNMIELAQCLDVLHDRRAALRLRLEGYCNERHEPAAVAEETPHFGIDGHGDRVGGDRAVGELGGASGLTKFSGRVISCETLELNQIPGRHRRLAQILDETQGDFTPAVAAEMKAMDLEPMSWLYRAEPTLPVLFVGNDIPIVSQVDRSRVLSRPVAEQPLPPSFLRLVLDQLNGLLVANASPIFHRITASIGGQIHQYDRMGARWGASSLITSSCIVGVP